MGFLSVDTEIHLKHNDCLVHGNIHWGGNTIGRFCSFGGGVILCLREKSVHYRRPEIKSENGQEVQNGQDVQQLYWKR